MLFDRFAQEGSLRTTIVAANPLAVRTSSRRPNARARRPGRQEPLSHSRWAGPATYLTAFQRAAAVKVRNVVTIDRVAVGNACLTSAHPARPIRTRSAGF